MSFIKFTVTKITTAGQSETIHFVNVDHVVSATYEESRKFLQLKIAGDDRTHSVHGDEAIAAAKVLCEHK